MPRRWASRSRCITPTGRASTFARRYATIYNPSGSFSLIGDDDEARQALATWIRHLAPGGHLLVAMGVPRADFDAQWEWHVRRSATRESDGVTFMVHEAMRCDVDAQVTHTLHRHELWDARGQLVTTFMRRHRLRWWTAEQMEQMLVESGAARVRRYGTDDEFIVVGDRALTALRPRLAPHQPERRTVERDVDAARSPRSRAARRSRRCVPSCSRGTRESRRRRNA